MYCPLALVRFSRPCSYNRIDWSILAKKGPWNVIRNMSEETWLRPIFFFGMKFFFTLTLVFSFSSFQIQATIKYNKNINKIVANGCQIWIDTHWIVLYTIFHSLQSIFSLSRSRFIWFPFLYRNVHPIYFLILFFHRLFISFI